MVSYTPPDTSTASTLIQRTYWLEFCPNTFIGHFQLSTLHDLDCLRRLVSWALWHVFNLLNHVVPLQHFTKDYVPVIQPRRDDGRDEELGAVGVFSRVRHA